MRAWILAFIQRNGNFVHDEWWIHIQKTMLSAILITIWQCMNSLIAISIIVDAFRNSYQSHMALSKIHNESMITIYCFFIYLFIYIYWGCNHYGKGAICENHFLTNEKIHYVRQQKYGTRIQTQWIPSTNADKFLWFHISHIFYLGHKEFMTANKIAWPIS